MRKALFVVAGALVLALPAPGLAATASVKIQSTGFAPKNITVAYGDTVTWTNSDTANHQVVANNGSFASPILTHGQTYSFTFKAAGTYNYHDALKPSLAGSVKANGPPPSLTLGAGSPILVYGESTTLTGTVSNGAGGEQVIVTARPYAGLSTSSVAVVSTGAGGGFSYTVTPTILTSYTATWKTATSQPVSVQIRPQVWISNYTSTRLWAHVLGPSSYAGRYVYLQRLSQFGQWVNVTKLTLGARSGRVFTPPALRGSFKYRVYLTVNEAGTGYLDAWSSTRTITHR